MVGIDGSAISQKALGFAFEEASWRGLELRAVHAWEMPAIRRLAGVDASCHGQLAQRMLSESLAGWRKKYAEVAVVESVVWDRPAHALLAESAGAALPVVGCHGRGRFPGMLLGSVSQTLLRYAPTSIA